MKSIWRGALHPLLVILAVSLVTPQDICVEKLNFYVSSTGNDSEDCLIPEQPHLPCGSISYLLHHIRQCAMVEVMDELVLEDTVLQLNSSWKNLSIVGFNNGTEAAEIHCRGDSGILLLGMIGFTLNNIHFYNCSFDTSLFRPVSVKYSTLLAYSTQDVLVWNCSFVNHSGSALFLMDTLGNTKVELSTFQGGESLRGEASFRSGGIVLETTLTTMPSISLEVASCTFVQNINRNLNPLPCVDLLSNVAQIGRGGAIDILNTGQAALLFTVRDTSFDTNKATVGGAISVIFSSYTNMSLFDVTFHLNSADCEGGAVMFASEDYAVLSPRPSTALGDLKLTKCKFTSNTAGRGGALAVTVGKCVNCANLINVTLRDTEWYSNSARDSGLAIAASGQVLRAMFSIQMSISGKNNFNINQQQWLGYDYSRQ